jgi:ATP-binding cassette subfamily C protein
MPPDAAPAENPPLASFLRLLVLSDPRRFGFAFGLLVLGGLTEGLSILLVIPLLGLVGEEGARLDLPVPVLGEVSIGLATLLAALVGLIAAHAIFMRYKNIVLARFLFDLLNRLRLDLFGAIARLRWEYFARQRPSDLHHLLTSDVERLYGAAMATMVLLQTLVLLVVYLGVSLLISPAMTLLSALLGAGLLAALAPVRRRAARFGRERTGNKREQYRTVSEFLSGLKTAKIHSAEDAYRNRLARNLDLVKGEAVGYMKVVSVATIASQVVSALAVAGIVYAGVAVWSLPLAQLVAFLLVLMRLSPRFLGLQQAMQDLLSNLTVYRGVLDFRERCAAEAEEAGESEPFRAPAGEIALEDVSFSYPDRSDEAALRRISALIPAGRITALIGPSGGGKSTLADIVSGLVQPTSGRVIVDGTVLDPARARAWRRHVAYVPQDPFLLPDGIGANLRLARSGASEAEMWDALEQANAADFVRAIPGGLDAELGDNGVALSGGQRQRIVLARALIMRPRLLILDEATSALDWESQALIARSIEALRGQLTILAIAHRASFVLSADHVIALHAGRIQQAGSREELMREAGPLARMIRAEASASGAAEFAAGAAD